MPEDKKRAAHRALVDRVLNGEGRASAQQRARAFGNDGLSPPLDTLIGKVATRPTQVTEADFAAAKASGLQRGRALRAGDLRGGRRVRPAVRSGTGGPGRSNGDARPNNATRHPQPRLPPRTKLLFALIRLFSRHPVPDAAKLVFYRPDFYGDRAKEFTHEAMRGPSAWSVGDRELMAAYVSKVNGSARSASARTPRPRGRRTRTGRGSRRCWPTWKRPPSASRSGQRCGCSAS